MALGKLFHFLDSQLPHVRGQSVAHRRLSIGGLLINGAHVRGQEVGQEPQWPSAGWRELSDHTSHLPQTLNPGLYPQQNLEIVAKVCIM